MKATLKLARVRQAVFEWTNGLRAASAIADDAAMAAENVAAEEADAQFSRRDRWDQGEAEMIGEAADLAPREKTIERLLELNPTAPVEFLDQFSDAGLEHYLARLTRARRPRGRDSVWVRRPESRAIVSHTRTR